MRRQAEPQAPGSKLTQAEGFGLLYRAVSGHATSLSVFVRTLFGTRAFEINAPVALLIMFIYCVTVPCVGMLRFGAVWLVALIVQRAITLIMRVRGWETHSRDDGTSWLVQAIVRPRPGDFAAKAFFEPLLAVIAGGLLSLLDPMLGLFVASGAVSLCLKRVVERGTAEAQYQAMRDQEFEMRFRMERYRSRNG